MTQTRIDQFYKVTSSSAQRKPEGLKDDTKKSSNLRGPAVAKMKGRQSSDKLKASPAYKNGKQNPYKMDGRETVRDNVPSGSKTFCSSKADANNSPTKVTESKTAMSPTAKTPPRNQQRTPTSRSGTRFTPKTSSPIKNALDKSPGRAKMARRKLFKDRTEELISATINNLNLAKEGAIANNNIDIHKVYSSGIFNYKYNPIDTTTSTKYESNDVVVPTDMYSLHLFLVVVTVFSNPINCGYFDRDELDFIFSLITLDRRAQALLIRMLKRKHAWHRVSSIKYDEIASDLKPVFDELVARSMFKSNMEEEDMSVLLNLLQADEIRKLCQEFKIPFSGKKESIRSILTYCSKTRSLFPWTASPATRLYASVNKRLGDCILLSTRVKEMVDRLIMLLIPNRKADETLVDVFLMLLRVETDQIKFPEVAISDFPIFVSKGHLLDYIEAKNMLSNVLSAIEEKRWETVRDLGTLAAQRLPLFLETESESLQDSALPRHIRKFMPGYLWLRVLCKSIDAFKKTKETIPRAIEFLQMLIGQDCHMKGRKGRWYGELIKIEMYHMKNLEASVAALSDAVSYEHLTEVDRLDLLDRAEMIVKRKSGISKHARNTVKDMLDNVLGRARLEELQSSITIKGILCGNTSQRKSSWCISNGVDQKMYGSVESLALYHYKDLGYPKGAHCEGAFPITLFATLFWDEIYNMDIPGAWVSLYQDAPLDLYSPEFYENRREQIDMKLQIVRKFDSETLSRHLKREFEVHCKYKSISQGNMFDDSNSLQEVTFCIGVEGVVGICERLIHNFALWSAGFPDLIVWNVYTKQYKIVEVKGPGDSLSTKQRLWLDYLNRLGLNTEVCYCEREEKQLDSALEAIIMRVNDLKNAIAAMIFKVEHEYETLNWPNFLDNFALISGHLTSLSKILGHDKAPNLRNLTVLPLRLNPEKDEELLRLTENRIPTFAHDLVPDYLRTKLEPQAEQKMLQLEAKAANVNIDTSHKQLAQYTKVISHVWDIASKAREDWESDVSTRATQAQTSSAADTHALLAAVGMGKGLKSDSIQMVQSGVNPVANSMMVGRPGNQQQATGQGPLVGQMNKAPSAIKTNIKAASQIHPYR